MRTIGKFKEDKDFIEVNTDWRIILDSLISARVGRRSAVLSHDFEYRGEPTEVSIVLDSLSRTNLPTFQAYRTAFNGVYGNNPCMEINLDD
jgi:hypothetical protein